MVDFDDPEFFWRPQGTPEERAAQKRERMEAILKRSGLGVRQPEHPVVVEQKRRSTAERMRQHDALFGIAPPYSDQRLKFMRRLGIPIPKFEVGDAEGQIDAEG